MDFNSIIITLITGGLVLLSFLKMSNAIEVNRKANSYFGVFVLLWATFWLDEMIIPHSLSHNDYVFILVRFIQFLVPIPFFISIIFYTNPHFKFSIKHLALFVVPLLFLAVLFCKPILTAKQFDFLYITLFMGHALCYTLLAYSRVEKHQKDIELFSADKESIDLKWIRYIIYAFIGSSLTILVYNMLTPAESLNIYINLFFLVVVYLVAFYTIRQKEIYPRGLDIQETIDPSYTGSTNNQSPKFKLISDTELKDLKKNLAHLMDAEKPYLDGELNLVKLAEKLTVSSHQLSYVINNGFGENFFHFVNKYRVKKATELLKNPQYDHLNILAIGFESGFNSKTSFNTTFKRMTSYTPTEYRKIRSDL